MCKHSLIAILALCGSLVGCATAPAAPYWSDAQWIDQLGARVQMHLAESQAVAEASLPVSTVTVNVTYSGGALEDAQITQSTGFAALDTAIKAAVMQVQPPAAIGPWADTPHRFALRLYVGRGWAALTRAIHRDIQQHADYPLAAMLNGASGVVVARFEYLNGRALNPRITRSSGYLDVDQSVISELSALNLPAPPPALRDHRLTFQSTVCFGPQALRCPRVSKSVYFIANAATDQACSNVAFRYENGKIADVHLAKATRYPELDRRALQLVTRGEFPSPSGVLVSGGSLVIPVCYTVNAQPPHKPSGAGGWNQALRSPQLSLVVRNR